MKSFTNRQLPSRKMSFKTTLHRIHPDSIASSIASQSLGLMFSFTPCVLVMDFGTERPVALHMWFVFFSIDVVFLNSDKQIIEIIESFKPWSFYRAKNRARYVIEAPAGFVKERRLRLGDSVEFRYLA